tara:strand:+ start:772 stop:1020 length:249 start_codon:yes stop_codon:yes gene_type:complete
MGEARRKSAQTPSSRKQKNNKISKDLSPRILAWIPITQEQENMFIQFTIRGAWVGIALLVLLWIVVRIVGPAAGWWVPSDLS